MTYASFLALFLGGPLLALTILTRRDVRPRPRHGWLALALHVAVAVIYTTPWDNYLVAAGVWWYDPARVLGVTLGWVPLEEYTFFVLQTLMTGLWLLWVWRGGPLAPPMPGGLRTHSASDLGAGGPGLVAAAGVVLVWAAAVVALAAGWQPATYLGLELGWFLPPVVLQLLVGGRILWQQRRLVAISLLPPIVYLSLTDALAIGAGVWSIDPEQTTGLLIGGVLPLEELIFFTLTNVLIVFGMVLFITLLRVPNSPKSSELSAGRGLGEH